MDPKTHEIFYERSVHFEETCPSLASSTPPSSFMDSDHSDDSDLEDEIPSTSTRKPPPSQGQQIVEDIPSSSTKPNWAQQTFDSAGSLVGNPSDTRRTRSQQKSFPHAYIDIALDPQSFKEASGIPKWDNQSAIEISKHPIQHRRTKHIEVHMHYIRELIHEQIIALQYCPAAEQVINIFTKPFIEVKYTHLRDLLGMWDVAERGVP